MILYQFPFSHFCEKARWALDHKGVAYACRNLLPGLHLLATRKLAPKSSVPILVDDGNIVQDSTRIIDYLDHRHPARPLTPLDPETARQALTWESYLDAEIGVPLRLWFYHHALPDRACALRFLLDGAPRYGRPLFSLIYPGVRAAMIAAMKIDDPSAREAERRLAAAFDKLDAAVGERPYLAGNAFSRADLTACALLQQFCAPGKPDAEVAATVPAPVAAFREAHHARPFARWVERIYRDHRGSSAAPA